MGSLEEVAMPQNGINFEGIAALSEAFSCNPKLRVLNLNDNTFTEKGANAMAKVRPNKKISVFPVTGLKILGRVGTHICF